MQLFPVKILPFAILLYIHTTQYRKLLIKQRKSIYTSFAYTITHTHARTPVLYDTHEISPPVRNQQIQQHGYICSS